GGRTGGPSRLLRVRPPLPGAATGARADAPTSATGAAGADRLRRAARGRRHLAIRLATPPRPGRRRARSRGPDRRRRNGVVAVAAARHIGPRRSARRARRPAGGGRHRLARPGPLPARALHRSERLARARLPVGSTHRTRPNRLRRVLPAVPALRPGPVELGPVRRSPGSERQLLVGDNVSAVAWAAARRSLRLCRV